MWELECEESWALKNWCFWTVVLEKTLESPLDCKEIQPVHSKGDQSWVFFGRTDVEAETPILWPPHKKNWLIGKDPDAGRDQGQEEKGTTEDEIGGWHHQLDGRESEWTPGVGDRQAGLACCDSWGCKESDTTEWLNWTEMIFISCFPQWVDVLLQALGWSNNHGMRTYFFLVKNHSVLKSLLEHHSSKASVLWCSSFFTFQLSHPYMTTGKTIILTRWTFVGKVMSLLFTLLSR